jgi:Flp pilus assembly protein TadG
MRTQFRHNEKGAELVEMAFVVLLFMVLMMGVFEFGRAYNIYQNITNAAREGARFAVAPARGGTINYPNNSEVSSVISGFMQSSNLNPASATINIQLNNQDIDPSCTPCNAGAGCACGTRVSISYPFSFLFYGGVNISTTVLMRNES